ncbi:MAG UNVERIFIED_CONTAM: type II toxin-antitoxin system VapC family toxin [Microcystis novacekii LVE1205-3]
MGNIVWKKHRLGLITEQEGIDILSDLLALNLLTVSTEILLPIAYNLATEFDRTVYDSLYLDLAQSRGVKFITADLRLYNSVHSKLNFVEC